MDLIISASDLVLQTGDLQGKGLNLNFPLILSRLRILEDQENVLDFLVLLFELIRQLSYPSIHIVFQVLLLLLVSLHLVFLVIVQVIHLLVQTLYRALIHLVSSHDQRYHKKYSKCYRNEEELKSYSHTYATTLEWNYS